MSFSKSTRFLAQVLVPGFIALEFLLLVAACSPGASQTPGTMSLSLPRATGRFVEVSTWAVTATGPDSTLEQEVSAVDQTITLADLAPGTWTIQIQGLDSAGNTLCTGSGSSNLRAGTDVDLSITMNFYHTLTLATSHGVGTSTSFTVLAGDPLGIPANPGFSCGVFSFTGWTTDAAGATPLSSTATMPDSDLTLYAAWNTDTLLVPDQNNYRIVAMDDIGGSNWRTWDWTSFGMGNNYEFQPWAVVADNDGILYVINSWDSTILTLNPIDASYTTLVDGATTEDSYGDLAVAPDQDYLYYSINYSSTIGRFDLGQTPPVNTTVTPEFSSSPSGMVSIDVAEDGHTIYLCDYFYDSNWIGRVDFDNPTSLSQIATSQTYAFDIAINDGGVWVSYPSLHSPDAVFNRYDSSLANGVSFGQYNDSTASDYFVSPNRFLAVRRRDRLFLLDGVFETDTVAQVVAMDAADGANPSSIGGNPGSGTEQFFLLYFC